MGYHSIAAVFERSTATGPARLVLVAIAFHINDEGGPEAVAWPSIATLMRECSMSKTRVHAALRRLVASGELRLNHKGGKRGCNIYSLNLPPPCRNQHRAGIGTVPESAPPPCRNRHRTETDTVPESAPPPCRNRHKDSAETGTLIEGNRKEQKEQNTTAEARLEFPVKAAKGQPELWAIGESGIRDYQDAFPGLDVLAELRRARSWCLSNPDRRKTARGMPRFLHNWLTTAAKDAAGRPVAIAQERREALAKTPERTREEWVAGFGKQANSF